MSSASTPSETVLSPCAACRILRRRCHAKKCVLAPYFPPTEPLKFTIAHRVFGASNIIKFLQELPIDQRADAVNSMVYEASARVRDPIYGCTGTICHLQKQVSDLQVELAKAQAQIVNMQCQNATLFHQISKETVPTNYNDEEDLQLQFNENPVSYNAEETSLGFSWEPLWT